MPRLQTFLTALTLLPSVSLAVAPAQVPPNGKGQGFIGNIGNLYPPPSGDWLTSTLCYCRSPTHAQEVYQYEKAHIFQHEYYNYHSNATFIVDHKCLTEAVGEGDQCIVPNMGGDNEDWFREDPYVCKKFARTEEEQRLQANSKRSTRREKQRREKKKKKRSKWPNWLAPHNCIANCDPGPFSHDPDALANRAHDKVCFSVGTNFYGMVKMELRFNGQHRVMKRLGDQGRVQTALDDVQGHCEDLCQSTFGMPAEMKIMDKRAGGGSRQFLYTSLDDMCDHCK